MYDLAQAIMLRHIGFDPTEAEPPDRFLSELAYEVADFFASECTIAGMRRARAFRCVSRVLARGR